MRKLHQPVIVHPAEALRMYQQQTLELKENNQLCSTAQTMSEEENSVSDLMK